MFSKVQIIQPSLESEQTELVSGVLHHFGRDLMARGHPEMATKWLERAFQLVNVVRRDLLSAGGVQLRLAICQDLVHAHINCNEAESIRAAEELIAYLESEIGDQPVVLQWRLDIMNRQGGDTLDADVYSSILRRLVHRFDFSEASFQEILQHVQGLQKRSTTLAAALLDEFLTTKLIPDANADWIGKAVVKRIWVWSTQTESSASAMAVLDVLGNANNNLAAELSPDVVAAVHSVSFPFPHSLASELIPRSACVAETRVTISSTAVSRGRVLLRHSASPRLLGLR